MGHEPGDNGPSVRRMVPLSIPDAQRENVLALHDLVKHASFEHSGRGAFRLINPAGEITLVPEPVLALLEQIVEALARGDAVTVVPVGKELTTQQAANVLNVSRQYVVQLLDEGRIPCHRTGTHRRIRVDDLMAFKRERDRGRLAALNDLARLSQALGGYDEIPASR